LGKKIEAFKVKNDGLLPAQQPFNRAQETRLDMELTRLENNIRNLEERKVYLQSQLDTISPASPIIGETGQRILGPADRLKALEIRLVDLRSKFSDDHPDVVKVRREIASLKKLVGQSVDSTSMRQKKVDQLRAQLAQLQGKYSDQYPEVKKLKNEIADLEKTPEVKSVPLPVVHPDNPVFINLSTRIQAANTDIASYRNQQAVLREKIQMYRQRLENAPKVEQEYLALMRDYQNAHSKHQEVMNKILEARIAEGMEEHQKGEKFTLIDPASYPEKPVSPNRLLILLAGIFCSFGAGFGTVALAEHLDHSVHDSDELARLTGLPVLGAIIRIKTKEDILRALRTRRLIWVISCGSLVLALILFHFLYMDLWVLAAKLLRLANKYT
jgi:succinoglycan biosynthesis transport protein ExoP